MKSTAFWKHVQELLPNKFMAFLESQSPGGLICALEAFGADGERYACVTKKSQLLPQREATIPCDFSRWSFQGNLTGKGEKGSGRNPQEGYTIWGASRENQARSDPIPIVDLRSVQCKMHTRLRSVVQKKLY